MPTINNSITISIIMTRVATTLTTTGTITFDDDTRIRNDFNILQHHKHITWVSSKWNRQRRRNNSTRI